MIHNESGVYILKNCRCAVSWFSGAILSNIRDNNPLLRHLGTLKSKITHIYIIVRVWQTSICKEGADDFIGNPLHTLPLYRNDYEFWELSLSAQNHENFLFLGTMVAKIFIANYFMYYWKIQLLPITIPHLHPMNCNQHTIL